MEKGEVYVIHQAYKQLPKMLFNIVGRAIKSRAIKR